MTLEQIIALIQAGGAPMAVVMAGLYWLERLDHAKTRADHDITRTQLYKALDNTDKIATALERLTGISGNLK